MKENKLFGTDGIRGVAMEFLTPELAYKVGKTLAIMFKDSQRRIVVGGDTRLSTNSIKYSLIAGALSHGADVVDAGILPTPVISFIVQKGYSCGVMITASHNPPEYNGIKVFNANGNKLDEQELKEFTYIFNNLVDYGLQRYDKVGKIILDDSIKEQYINAVVKDLDISLNGIKIALDCSFGACATLAESVFRELKADVSVFNTEFDGLNINRNCGALHPEFIKKTVMLNDFDIGFAFDGDGDRIVCVLKDGKILDGDDLLYVLSRYLSILGQLYGNKIVATILTNCGVENSLKKYGISLIRTAVGDKNVSKELQDKKLLLGGEKSGHIIYTNFSKTGDGIYIAGLLLKLQRICGQSIEKIISDLEVYPYCEKDIVVLSGRENIIKSPIVKSTLDECLSLLADSGRIVLRPSGTESKIRILVEGQDAKLNAELADELATSINKAYECFSSHKTL